MLACVVITYLLVARGCSKVRVTTVITHGYTLPYLIGDEIPDPWVNRMAKEIKDRTVVEKNGPCSIYTYEPSTGHWTSAPGMPSPAHAANQLVLIFDWAVDSSKKELFLASAAADALYAALRAPTGDLAGVELIEDRHLHLIGHSRGASVNSEVARRLSTVELPVDHMTTLDPHPIDGSRNELLKNECWNMLNDCGDPVPEHWTNIRWFDNYYRQSWAWDVLSRCDPDGIALGNQVCNFECELDESALWGEGWLQEHSDVHLWYLATIDLTDEVCEPDPIGWNPITWVSFNQDECIDEDEFDEWFTGLKINGNAEGVRRDRQTIGYRWSRIAGGSESNRPKNEATKNSTTTPVPILHNGSFEGTLREPGLKKNLAGWNYHGGELPDDAVVQNNVKDGGFHLVLESSDTTQVLHNRFYLPENADTLSFNYKAIADSSSEPNANTAMKLRIDFMVGEQSESHLIIHLDQSEDLELREESLDNFNGQIVKGRVYRLQLKIDDDSSAGLIILDDIDVTLR